MATASERRYQVFVSSTYEDLQEERREVMQALLELDCIPAGMELFPAADETQWNLIRRVIDDCDYYLVIVGGRYGSIGPDGLSYTEMEYRYALEQSKPIIAFLHKDPTSLPAKRTDSAPGSKEKLDKFRDLCRQKLVKTWASASELGSVVSRSLVRLIKDRPAVGWVRADELVGAEALEELVRKTKQVEDLQRKLAAARTQAPPGTENLASGEDDYQVEFSFTATDSSAPYGDRDTDYKATRDLTWNDLFGALSPHMIDEVSDSVLRRKLNDYLQETFAQELGKSKGLKGKTIHEFQITDADFQTIKVQFTALGLTSKGNRGRSVKDKATYWTLTPYGEQHMIRLRAIRRDESAAPDA